MSLFFPKPTVEVLDFRREYFFFLINYYLFVRQRQVNKVRDFTSPKSSHKKSDALTHKSKLLQIERISNAISTSLKSRRDWSSARHRCGQVTRVCPSVRQMPQERGFLAAGGLVVGAAPVVPLPRPLPSPPGKLPPKEAPDGGGAEVKLSGAEVAERRAAKAFGRVGFSPCVEAERANPGEIQREA